MTKNTTKAAAVSADIMLLDNCTSKIHCAVNIAFRLA
jgi:hypothetical protein